MRTIVASFKCPGFKRALFGKGATQFLSDAGVVDQATGGCQADIARHVEDMSVEILSDEAGFCAKAKAALEADPVQLAAARRSGAY